MLHSETSNRINVHETYVKSIIHSILYWKTLLEINKLPNKTSLWHIVLCIELDTSKCISTTINTYYHILFLLTGIFNKLKNCLKIENRSFQMS